MKKVFTAMLLLALSGCMYSTLFAAELLDVRPIVTEDSVSVQISANIAMTYTYYKVPGQPRAVVDIAEADPEKIEPLIVVNKGVVSSISVDSAQISGIVVSRIIFNLVSDADFSVTASPDRKLLVVTFGGSAPAASIPGIKPESVPEIKPEAVPESVAAVTVTTAEPAATRALKLEPVVPADIAPALPSALKITDIVVGTLSIEIHTNQSISDYKIMKLSGPDRFIIDIPCEKADQRPNVTAINKFGISKVRIGVTPRNIRIVMDSSKAGFPAHSITKTTYGLRINFK